MRDRLRLPGERIFGAFDVALQQQADAPIVPTLAVRLFDHRLPVRLTERDLAFSRATVTIGRPGPARLEGIFAAIVIDPRLTRAALPGRNFVVVGELAVVQLLASSVTGPRALGIVTRKCTVSAAPGGIRRT